MEWADEKNFSTKRFLNCLLIEKINAEKSYVIYINFQPSQNNTYPVFNLIRKYVKICDNM